MIIKLENQLHRIKKNDSESDSDLDDLKEMTKKIKKMKKKTKHLIFFEDDRLSEVNKRY